MSFPALPFDIWKLISQMLSAEAKQKIQNIVNEVIMMKSAETLVDYAESKLEVTLSTQVFMILCTKFIPPGCTHHHFHIHIYRCNPTKQLIGTITDSMIIYGTRNPGNYKKAIDESLPDQAVRFACLFMHVYDKKMFMTAYPKMCAQLRQKY